MAKLFKKHIFTVFPLPIEMNDDLICKANSEGYNKQQVLFLLCDAYLKDELILKDNSIDGNV